MVALVAACLGMGMVSNEQKLEYHLMNSSTSSQGVVSSGFAPVGVVMNNRLMNSSRSSSQGMVSSGFGPAVHPISYPPFPPHVDHAPPPSITTCRPPSPTRRSGTTTTYYHMRVPFFHIKITQSIYLWDLSYEAHQHNSLRHHMEASMPYWLYDTYSATNYVKLLFN